MAAMLDLAFVRANLPLVEEKLRARNMDPDAVLGDFKQLDAERRRQLTELESKRAELNAETAKVEQALRSGRDRIRQLKENLANIEAPSGQKLPKDWLAVAVDVPSDFMLAMGPAAIAIEENKLKLQIHELSEPLKPLKQQIKLLEEATSADTQWKSLLAEIPNLPQPSVPEGTSADDNVLEKVWGQ